MGVAFSSSGAGAMSSNPFFELYAGDRITPADFVKLFSRVLVPHAVPIFAPGNAVVTGRQGSGKSMLLSLLKPEIRLQYHLSDEEFPVPIDQRKFLSSSVNLAHSNAIDFGLRRAGSQSAEGIQLIFADFLNYLVVKSFLSCLRIYANSDNEIRSQVGLKFDSSGLDKVGSTIANLDVWDGWVGRCENFAELEARVSKRILTYRRYLHQKIPELDPDFAATRTSIGAPILAISDALRKSELVDSDTQFFVDIDQYEELENIITDHVGGELVDYRSVINKALANRNAQSVSYRIGTRAHAWAGHGRILGTNARLEQERDYKYVELDEILVRREHTKNDPFRAFAQDVFERRMHFTSYNLAGISSPLDHVYSPKFSHEEKAKRLSLRDPKIALRLPEEVGAESWQRLLELCEKDLLSAKLGEIWLRQKGDVSTLSKTDGDLPWNKATYWKKERKDIALLQIASDAQQKPLWGGAAEVIGLAGGNILVFLSLNQYIWDTWNLYRAKGAAEQQSLPTIDLQIQSVGIQKASKSWVEKMTQETGRSSERARFIQQLAEFLTRRIFGDKKVSNPGHTGFSVLSTDLNETPNVKVCLDEMADYGNLFKLPHTTKNNDRRQRVKFYLNPIFCPHFGIPFVRTKEPYYAKLSDIVSWMASAGYEVKVGTTETQQSLEFGQ
jgi:hypothetical protein